jgi:hypothetical protein
MDSVNPMLNTNDVRALLSAISAMMADVDYVKDKLNYSTGEVKDAYALIHNDAVWKLQKKVGQLWFYVCGAPIVPFSQTLNN